jgi:hypothetical protein
MPADVAHDVIRVAYLRAIVGEAFPVGAIAVRYETWLWIGHAI